MLFTERSLWTMIHGIVMGGAPLLGLSAVLFVLYSTPLLTDQDASRTRESRLLAWLMVGIAVSTWLAVLVGTYVVFPPYRVTPPAGLTDLAQYPRSLIQSKPETVWLHAFAMEIKEHMPWIAAMLTTAGAFIGHRYRTTILADRQLRTMLFALCAISFALVSLAAILGIFVNKVAPLQ